MYNKGPSHNVCHLDQELTILGIAALSLKINEKCEDFLMLETFRVLSRCAMQFVQSQTV